MRASRWGRNAGLAAAAAAAALTVAGCSSDVDGDAGAAATSPVTSAASPGTEEPGAPAPAPESAAPGGPTSAPEPMPTDAPAQRPAPGADGQGPGGGQDRQMTRDEATEQLKRLLGAPEDARWEGDTLHVTMSWGSAEVQGMDSVCQGAQMVLQQYGGTLTMDFPDGTSRTCRRQ